MFVSINGVEISMRGGGGTLCIVLAVVGEGGGRACEKQCGARQ
jgi:hypothetical protein